MNFERKYGTATTLLFPLVAAGATDYITSTPTFVAADTQIMKDEAAFANTGSVPVYEGNGYCSLALTAAEMQAARIVVTVIDAATKVWEDQSLIIETYGHPSSQHLFDRSAEQSAISTTVGTVTSQTQLILADGPTLDDTYNGQLAIIRDVSSANDYHFVTITDYVAATKTIVIQSAAPFVVVAGDQVTVVPVVEGITVADVWTTRNIAELAQAVPSATPTAEAALMLIYMALRNKIDITATLKEFHNDAGTVVFKKTLSDNGTTYTEDEMAAGP